MNIRYLILIADAPLTVVRFPTIDGRKRTDPRELTWRQFLKGMTLVMQSYGKKQKDIYNFDPLSYRAKDLVTDLAKVESAFAGSTEYYRKFKLWDWIDGKFVLVRDAVEKEIP